MFSIAYRQLKNTGIIFGIEIISFMILWGKIASGGWDRTNDQSVILGYKVLYL